jgi:hypothetical protein
MALFSTTAGIAAPEHSVQALLFWLARAVGALVFPPVVAAIMQWLVLRRELARPGGWLVASLLGFGLALPMFATAFGIGVTFWGEESILTLMAGCLAFGAAVGVPQWFFLRFQCNYAGWWLPPTIFGLSISVILFMLTTRGFDVGLIGSVVAGTLAGAVYGFNTGPALVWLLSNPLRAGSGPASFAEGNRCSGAT